VPVVGDSLRDLQAGAALGCKPHLVRTGKGAATEPGVGQRVPGTVVHDDLAAFAEHMIQQERLMRGNAGLGDASLGRLD